MLLDASVQSDDTRNGKIIWKNDDPTVVFPAQTINVDLSIYRAFCIITRIRTDDADSEVHVNIYVNNPHISQYRLTLHDYAGVYYRYYRDFTIGSNFIEFGSAYNFDTGASDDRFVAPQQIYGFY